MKYVFAIIAILWNGQGAHAACGATNRTWTAGAGTVTWTTAANWNVADVPDTSAENAIIVSASRVPRVTANTTVGCVDVQSGQISATAARTLTITGDYFRNLAINGLNITSTGFIFSMSGTAAQTFENVDQIPRLTIANNTSVTLTQPFIIDTAFTISGTTSTVNVDADLILLNGIAAVTIPSGTTLHLRSGATLTANTNITVNGSLILDSGTTLLMGNGRTLSVGASGNVQLNGADGSVALISSTGAGSTFTFNMAGLMSASYFRIDRTTTAGLNVTGTVQSMSNGEFHYIASAGQAITLGASSAMPTTMSDLAFYDDSGFANVSNVNATAYTGSVITLSNYSGGVGGAAFEIDPSNKLTWGSPGATKLVISNNTAAGSPPATLGQSSADTLFATFAFSLNQNDIATDITSIKITQTGTGSSSDVTTVKIYQDTGGGTSCVYDAGVDTIIGSGQALSSSPASTTFSIPAATIQTSGPGNVVCVHVLAATTATAQDAQTLKFTVSSTNDVVNSQGYEFSPTAGPPVSGGTTTIVGDALRVWQGDTNSNFNTAGNWLGGVPTTATDCRIGTGNNVTLLNVAAGSCQNVTLQSGGTLNYNSTTNELRAYAKLLVQSGFNFTNAVSGVLSMRGASNQNLDLNTTFPGNFTVVNTGTAPNNVVSVLSSGTISGNLTVTSGVFSVANGVTLSVGGNITVASGATLEVLPGGTLAVGNASVLTVNPGGILKLIGTTGSTSRLTSTLATNAYTVVINGEIQAQYYTVDHLGTAGFSVESGATINATNYLQNGTFNYPVNNNTTLLKLKRQVPGNTLSGMNFSLNGSSATNTINVDTTSAAAGTLSITSYSGDLGGPAFDTDPTYNISWSGATNTITINQDQIGPATVDAGATYKMGRFGFKQTLAGASYSDTNLTSLKVTLTGTGTSGDISAVRIYKDTDCDSASGTLIGSGALSGNPASHTFSITSGDFVIAASTTTPPKNCIYIEYDIANAATNAKTVGVSIAASTDQVNSQSYLSSGSVAFPLTLGSPATINGATNTTWTGNTNANWFTAANWTSGVPDATKNCTINNVTNDPVVSGATATCKSATIGDGVVTFTNGTSARLDIYGSYTNTGTVTQNDAIFRVIDGGAGTNQTISSSSTITNFEIEKTGGGTVSVGSSTLTINSLTFKTGNTATFSIPSAKTLILPNGVAIPNGTLDVVGGGTLAIGNGSTITLNGGTFKTSGTHDQYPQNLAAKGKITVNGAGAWGFTATSGTLSLVGFVIDYVNTNGLNVGGTTNFTNFRGGHFTNLSTNYAAVKVMQINTSSVPSAPADVEWYWGPNNTPPNSTDPYLLASSTGCGSNTITFNNWWGDFFDYGTSTPDPNTKISETNCDFVISYANSPVSLLSFISIPYDGEVVLQWVTGSENNHHGFNVYRSQNYDDGYIQINSDLVRNNFANLGPQGSYEFRDPNVVNGRLYYYVIEDVSTAGVREKHGPVAVMPLGGLGSPPNPGAGTNDGQSDPGSDTGNDPGTGIINNPGWVDLGHGVHILSQTRDSLRIEIVPTAPTFTVSAWDSSYDEVTVPGYAKSLTPGSPELVDKVVLIEVEGSPTNVTLTGESVTESAIVYGHRIQPAPSWSLNGSNILVPTYAIDATVYSTNSFIPTQYYTVSPTTKDVNGKKYIEIAIHPLKYNPVVNQVRPLQKAVLDIGLDGNAWSTTPNPGDLAVTPSAVPGVIRIRYEKAGFYELTFDDLVNLGIEGYYNGVDTDELRGYYLGNEIPLEIRSADGTFNTGDKIRFWADFQRTQDSTESEIVISKIPLGLSSGPALRYTPLNGDPSSYPTSTITTTEARAEFEQDLLYINDKQMGDLQDHFYWVRLGKWNSSQASFYPSTHTFSVSLPGLNPNSQDKVKIHVHLRGRTQNSQNATHHLGVFVNSNPQRIGNYIFDDYYPTTALMSFDANQFIDGNNDIKLETVADTVPVGDWALLDIDRIAIYYPAYLTAYQNLKELYKIRFNESIEVSGFTSNNISLYDVSSPEGSRVITNANIFSPDGGLTYSISFGVTKDSADIGYRLLAIEDSAVQKPTQVFLNYGFEESLKDTTQGADLIIIGHNDLIDAAHKLVDQRASEGIRVKTVTLQQIYDEFSGGLVSAVAIRDFLSFAYNYWSAQRPQYVLILGDATTDIRNRLGFNPSEVATPVVMLSGDYADYASDSWFVTLDGEVMPRMAVGRIPASNIAELEEYIDKMLAYENGTRSPAGFYAYDYGFFSDADTLYEGFATKSQQLASTIRSANTVTTTWHKPLTDYSSNVDFNTAIINQFDTSSLIMSFVGHGSEDRWGDNLFTNIDAKNLNNTRLPIILGLNCSTANFYDADMSIKNIGEAFVMNAGGGAIAYWASTTYTTPETQVRLTQTFYDELSKSTKNNYQVVRIGDLIQTAKAAVAGQTSAKDSLRSWTLLGDPTMKIPQDSFTGKTSSADSDDGGGGGCGLIVPHGPQPPPGMVGLLFILPLGIYLFLRQRRTLYC